ncbi:hypothetical protein AB0B89_31065 [Sphaerisporangium sp. NPDC049002]|uniref:hypothetical protein n=1 Tax=Sphaerisporangium sp. NPDC049002 TaxID=3155392 RepID=UPI003404FB92
MSDRAEYIKGLRALADILENHPDLPLPYDGRGGAIDFIELGEEDRRGAAVFARVMPGTVRKEPRDTYLDLVADVHGVKVKWIAMRSNVCERVVTGTREVEIEEPDPQALAAVPKVKRTVTVEDVEWQCGSLLATADAEQAAAVTA